MSCTVKTVARCLVGLNAQRKAPFQRQRTNGFEPSHPSHSRRENKWRRRVKLGLNESERLGFANMMNKRVVPCNAL